MPRRPRRTAAAKVSLLLGATLPAGSAGAAGPPFPDAALPGVYRATACADGRAWGLDPHDAMRLRFHRTYTVRPDGGFKVRYVFFADARCTRPQVAATWRGRWRLGPAVAGLPFTREGEFPVEGLSLVALSPQALARTASCGRRPWRLRRPQDVTAAGCTALSPLFVPVAAGTVDHDIVRLRNGVFTPGLRTPDMARTPLARPTRLQVGIPALRR